MRIAIDCRYVRERPSGIGQYVGELVRRLPALAPDDRFQLWAHPRAHRPLSSAPNSSDVVVNAEPNTIGPLLWPRWYAPLYGIELFHAAHNVLPRGLSMPTVVTIHDLLALEHPGLHRSGLDGFAKRFYYGAAVWHALRKATRLIATTEVMANRIADFHPPAQLRTVVIALAPGEDCHPATDRTALHTRVESLIGTSAPYCLVVGQNSPTKAHHIAVAAFAAAAPASWRLVLLQRTTKSVDATNGTSTPARGDRVIRLPGVSRHDLVALMQGAQALLQPSTYEGYGLPVVEAMACGCPVIASDLPTLREVAADGAMFTPPGDLPRFTAALSTLAGSPAQRAELSIRGRRRAGALSWQRCAEETLAVYRDAARAAA
jgi:glycosyltransferase involved in cell wall biosynthesis